MGLTTKYLTNLSNFEEVTEYLRTTDKLPDQVTKSHLEQLGYTNAADALIPNFFKDLKFLEEDYSPALLLKKFRAPSTSREALAEGILNAYEDLFEEDPKVYRQSKDKIIKLLESLLEEEKSDMIINYMADTFRVLVKYVGHNTLEAVLQKRELEKSSRKEETKDEIPESEAVLATVNGEKSKIDKDTQNSLSGSLDSEEPLNPEVDELEEESVNKQITAYVNKAYFKKAELLYKLERYEEALPALDNVYQKFANSDTSELYRFASCALVKKMKTAEKLELKDYLVPIYSVVIDRFTTTQNGKFSVVVDHAYMSLIECLIENDQAKKALEVVGQAIHRFKDQKQNVDFMAKAMFIKGELLEQSEEDEKALEAFEDFLEIFG